MSELTQYEIVEKIVTEGFENQLDDDQMLFELVKEGIAFRDAPKVFREFVEASGLRLSAKNRSEQINSILENEEFNPTTNDQVLKMVERIEKQVSDTSEKQALKLIKVFLKSKDIEFPKAEKKASFKIRFLDYAASDYKITSEELKSWIFEETGKSSEEIEKVLNRYSTILDYGRKVAKRCFED